MFQVGNESVRRKEEDKDVPLETFIIQDDLIAFGTPAGLIPLEKGHPIHHKTPLKTMMLHADLTLHNPYTTYDQLLQAIQHLDLLNPDRLRPSWDTYFMHLAELAARRANCMKRRVGCILVRDNQVVATGYNGTPRGLRNCDQGGCKRCNQGVGGGEALHLCLCLHAEENALLEAGRERIRHADWCILYCNTCPCIGCARKIIQAGVKEVVYSRAYSMDEESARIFHEAGVKMRQHLPVGMRLELTGTAFQI